LLQFPQAFTPGLRRWCQAVSAVRQWCGWPDSFSTTATTTTTPAIQREFAWLPHGKARVSEILLARPGPSPRLILHLTSPVTDRRCIWQQFAEYPACPLHEPAGESIRAWYMAHGMPRYSTCLGQLWLATADMQTATCTFASHPRSRSSGGTGGGHVETLRQVVAAYLFWPPCFETVRAGGVRRLARQSPRRRAGFIGVAQPEPPASPASPASPARYSVRHRASVRYVYPALSPQMAPMVQVAGCQINTQPRLRCTVYAGQSSRQAGLRTATLLSSSRPSLNSRQFSRPPTAWRGPGDLSVLNLVPSMPPPSLFIKLRIWSLAVRLEWLKRPPLSGPPTHGTATPQFTCDTLAATMSPLPPPIRQLGNGMRG
jgi:hypothetical protein